MIAYWNIGKMHFFFKEINLYAFNSSYAVWSRTTFVHTLCRKFKLHFCTNNWWNIFNSHTHVCLGRVSGLLRNHEGRNEKQKRCMNVSMWLLMNGIMLASAPIVTGITFKHRAGYTVLNARCVRTDSVANCLRVGKQELHLWYQLIVSMKWATNCITRSKVILRAIGLSS